MALHMVRRIIVSTFLVATALTLLAGGEPARAAAPPPDFTGVEDILAGRRRLFPVDDLVATLSPNNTPVTVDTQFTTNSGFGSVSSLDVTGGSEWFATGVGRMFDLPNDVVVTLTSGQVTIQDLVSGYGTLTFPSNANASPNLNQFPVADFTGDGYADFAYIQQGAIYIMTAQNVEDPKAGILISDAGQPPFDLTNTWAVLAAGDFDADGRAEVALAAEENSTITVAIYDVFITYQNGQVTNFSLSEVGHTSFGIPNDVAIMAATAGVFSGAVRDPSTYPFEQLILMYEYPSNNNNLVELQAISVAPAADPPLVDLTVGPSFQLIDSETYLDYLSIDSDYLDFWGPTEQLVVGVHEQGYNSYISIFTFDSAMNFNQAQSVKVSEGEFILMGLALGNYDQDSNTNPSANVDLEIAALTLDVSSDIFPFSLNPNIHLYDVAVGNNFAFGPSSNADAGIPPYQLPLSDSYTWSSITAGDVQGRSLLLGTPSRVTAQHVQPAVIMGMPPMHVDYAPPATGGGATVLNVSAVPLSFYSSYQTQVTNQQQSSHQGTTSFSTSLTESINQKVVMGEPDIASVTIDTKTSATQAWANSVAKTYNSYVSTQFDASTQTGFDDQIWYNSERQNIYIYPVIGHTGCPVNQSCPPTQPVPLNVMFSGPDQIMQTSVGGSLVEWFQPLREPGNVFSYPWNLELLQQRDVGGQMQLLTSGNPTQFFTDSSTRTQQAQWSAGNSQNVTTGSSQNYSWSKSVSIDGDVSADVFGIGGGTSFSFSYDGSKSFSSLNSHTTTLGASTGMGVNKPGTFPNPDLYQYPMQPYIYGTSAPTATIQSLNLGTDIQTAGILRAEFTVDPTDPSTGSWWQATYTQPDVALIHPSRWFVPEVTSGGTGANCLPTGVATITNCANFNKPNSNLWLSEFHWMKGFYITPAETNGDGPQIDQATAGDQVALQAAVYNYSLADMPANSEVVVQFYGQPWNPNTLEPIGGSFLIDTVALPPIPGFNSNSNGGTLPNYNIAQTNKLDTSAYAGQSLAFWVLVWIQANNNGQTELVPEMPEHGLTAIPGTLSSIPAANHLLQPYSNNIGLYKSLFYVAPANNTVTSRPPASGGKLSFDEIKLSKGKVNLNKEVSVSAVVRSAQAAQEGLVVAFYDGKPNNEGKAFEVERISHIDADSTHRVLVPYRATSCGKHTLYVQTQPGGKTAHATLNVTINAKTAVRKLTNQIEKLTKAGRAGGGLLELLNEANKALKQGNKQAALDALHQFADKVSAQSGKGVPAKQAKQMLARTEQVFDCVKP